MSEDSIRKRFSLFKKKTHEETESKTNEATWTFDETSLNFELKGGAFNTNLIEACATVKHGPNEGMPLPLSCTWYRSTTEKQFVTIEGVNGAFYQPNADDIGCKICVHAVPVSEVEEYIGMPAFSEIGPVQIDPEVQKMIMSMYESNNAEFTASVYGGTFSNLTNGPVNVKITNNMINLFYADGREIITTKLNMGFPQISILHKTNTSFSLLFEDERIDLNAERHVDRDVIVITVRMFSAKASSESQTDSLIKIEQLSSRLLNLNKEYENTLSSLNLIKEENNKTEIIFEESKARVKDLEQENTNLYNLYVSQSATLERNDSELKFLRQDILVYKNQYESLEHQMNSQMINDNGIELLLNSVKEDINEIFKKYRFCEKCKKIENVLLDISSRLDDRMLNSERSSSNSSVKSFQDEGGSESTGTDDHEKEIRELKDQILNYKCKLKQLTLETAELVNRAEAEKNFYKRKSESLSSDNDKLLSKLGKNPKEIASFARERQEFEFERERILKELKLAQESATNYEKLGKINKKKLEEEIDRNFELRKVLSKKSKTMTALDYQKIINSLTMSISDREEELSQQKNINRELMNRIQELSQVAV